jgi:hypothetical protein
VAARRECHEKRGHCPPRSREDVPVSWLAWLGRKSPKWRVSAQKIICKWENQRKWNDCRNIVSILLSS